MRSKLLVLLLFLLCLNSFGQSVPNTNTFSLQDVVNVINPTTDDLMDCFTHAENYKFDPEYEGSKNSLLNFRNYGSTLPSWCIGILNIVTRPFYIGAQPALGVSKQNHFHLIYITGLLYDDSDPLNITKWIKWQSDDSDLFSLGASDLPFINTQRPKILEVTGTDLQTMMSAGGLYFKTNNNGSILRSLNPNISYISGSGNLRMNFNLVAGATALPTISLGESNLYFDGYLNAITTNQFSITADGDWYIIIPNANISVDKWYGSGNDNIVITVSEHDIVESEAIKVYSMANQYSAINITSYVPGYVINFLGYVSWSFDYELNGILRFVAWNGTSSPHAKDNQNSTLYWEIRDGNGDPIESGQVSVTGLNNQTVSYPTVSCSNFGSAASLWGYVSGGSWIRLW